jgi:hypothetical protein
VSCLELRSVAPWRQSWNRVRIRRSEPARIRGPTHHSRRTAKTPFPHGRDSRTR